MDLSAILARYRAGELSAPMTLVELTTATEDLALVERSIEGSQELGTLFVAHRDGLARIVHMLASGLDVPTEATSIDEGIARTRALFDWSVGQSEESSVAFHSLGSAELLARATDEIVAHLRARGVLHGRVLQIGCGTGRIERAIEPFVEHAVGIDVSPNMIEVARRNAPSAQFVTTDGRTLAFPTASFDLVYAVDSFPYIVQAGDALVTTHFDEAHRVLRPRGAFVILSFSYRGLDVDRADVARHATRFDVAQLGTRPLSLWPGGYFELRRR